MIGNLQHRTSAFLHLSVQVFLAKPTYTVSILKIFMENIPYFTFLETQTSFDKTNEPNAILSKKRKKNTRQEEKLGKLKC